MPVVTNRLLQPPPQARASSSTGTLYLYDAIGSDGFTGIGAKDVVDALAQLRADGHQNLDVRISSPGGSVFDGLAIYRAISEWKGKKTCMVDGLAASAASFIMLAADKVVAAPEAMVMIHEAHGIAVGNASDLEATAKLLRQANESIASIYATRTRMDPQQARDYMAAETWFTARDACSAGLVSSVLEDAREPVTAALSDGAAAILNTFKNTPSSMRVLAKPEALLRLEMRLLREKLSKASVGRGVTTG
jgi:ATP-dependent Clp endopeptidase proteolytic subunit ClpP